MTSEAERADVAVIGPGHLDSFARNVADGFEDIGMNAQVVDPFASFAGQGSLRVYSRYGVALRRLADVSEPVRRRLIDRPVAEALERLSPRLVVCVVGAFGPSQVEAWRRRTSGATWALWYPDAFVNLGAHRAFLAPYDHFFFKDPYIVETLADRARLPAHYLAQASNPRHHRRLPDNECREPTCDVVIVGNMYPFRLLALEPIDRAVTLQIYGNRPHLPARFARLERAHTGRTVFGEEKARVFKEARIVLSTMHYGELYGVNSRLFEATGSGGFVLTHENAALGRYFEPGSEVATFDTPASMNAAILHYLAHPDQREAIARAGCDRTRRDHIYPRRVAELLRVCGLAPSPSDRKDSS